MAGRMVCAIALGIPVLAGLAYLVLSGAPLAYGAGNGLSLAIALAAIAFLRVRLSDRQCRILAVLLLLSLYVPLLTGPHVNGIARWLALGPIALMATRVCCRPSIRSCSMPEFTPWPLSAKPKPSR